MLHSEIELAKLREDERSHKQQEKLQAQANRVQAAGHVLKAFGSVVGKKNDLVWHAKDLDVSKIAASSSFAYPSGVTTADGVYDASAKIITLYYLPTTGGTVEYLPSKLSPFSIAAEKIWQDLRGANAGYASNYDPEDIATYLLTVQSPYAMIEEAIRAFSIARRYSATNLAENRDVLLEACGYGWLSGATGVELSNFWLQIQNAIAAVQTLPVPQGLNIYDRWAWLNGNIFAEDTSDKSRFFICRPSDYPVYRESVSNVMFIKLNGDTNVLTDVEQWVTKFSELFDAIRYSSDFKVIIGDMIKYGRGETNYLRVPFANVSYDDHLDPLYDEEFRDMVLNMTMYQVPRQVLVTNSDNQLVATGFLGYNRYTGRNRLGYAFNVDMTDKEMLGRYVGGTVPVIFTAGVGASNDVAITDINFKGKFVATSGDGAESLSVVEKVFGRLNFYDEMVTPSDVILATTTKSTVKSKTVGYGYKVQFVDAVLDNFAAAAIISETPLLCVDSCSSELWVGMDLWNFTFNESEPNFHIICRDLTTLLPEALSNANGTRAEIKVVSALNAWDFHPPVTFMPSTSVTIGGQQYGGLGLTNTILNTESTYFGNLDNFSFISQDRLNILKRLDLLSLLDLSMIGQYPAGTDYSKSSGTKSEHSGGSGRHKGGHKKDNKQKSE